MALMKLTFSDVYIKVSEFIGLGSSPAGDDLTKVKDIVYRGYRRFLSSIDPVTGKLHIWSFLKQRSTINTTADKWEYQLPSDFVYSNNSLKFDDDEGRSPLVMCSVSKIMTMRSFSASSNYPLFYAIRAGKYFKDTGQRYEVILHPQPGGVYLLKYSYVIEPEKPTETSDVFVGGSLASECILQCSLAAAELQENDEISIQNQMAEKLLFQLIEQDRQLAPDTVGYNGGGTGVLDNEIMARSFRKIPAPTSVYGVSD